MANYSAGITYGIAGAVGGTVVGGVINYVMDWVGRAVFGPLAGSNRSLETSAAELVLQVSLNVVAVVALRETFITPDSETAGYFYLQALAFTQFDRINGRDLRDRINDVQRGVTNVFTEQKRTRNKRQMH